MLVLRAACSPETGTGHLHRCMTLGRELIHRQREVMLVTDDTSLARQVAARFADSGRVDFVPPDVLVGPSGRQAKALVLDVPNTSGSLLGRRHVLAEIAELDTAGTSVISLGHVANTSHHLRAVVDLYPSREIHSSNYFEGPEYLILRPEYAEAPPSGRPPDGSILVTMGGSDPHNLTRMALMALTRSGFRGRVTIVLGPGYPAHSEQELRRCGDQEQRPWTFHRDVDDMRSLIRQHAAGIVAFGTTAYECMSQGLPVLTLSHYKWQEPSARLFAELGCSVYLGCAEAGLEEADLADQLAAGLGDAQRLAALGARGRAVVDGKGAQRVADLIEQIAFDEGSRRLDALFVLAHPGDELLGCGGTLLALTAAGRQVGLVILGEGTGSRRRESDDAAASRQASQRLKSALQTVVEQLGIRTWYYHRFADNRFDAHDLLDLVKVIESVVRRHHPRSVYTHHPGDLNVDHRRTFEAVVTALRPTADQTVTSLFSVEVPSSSDWGELLQRSHFAPNWFADVSATLERKLELILNYTTEVKDDPHPRSVAGIRGRAQHWGRLSGLDAAEAFVLHRHVERGSGH